VREGLGAAQPQDLALHRAHRQAGHEIGRGVSRGEDGEIGVGARRARAHRHQRQQRVRDLARIDLAVAGQERATPHPRRQQRLALTHLGRGQRLHGQPAAPVEIDQPPHGAEVVVGSGRDQGAVAAVGKIHVGRV
jgi:hypothetical protein